MTRPHELPAVALAAMLVVAVAPASARAEPVRLSDGDSFRLGDQRYRLQGIDAPELHQDCKDANGKDWPCGMRARSELRRLIGTHPVECRAVTIDRFGRIVANCTAGGKDLAEEMVRSGFAVVFTRPGFSSPYDKAQTQARAEKRGIWAGTFDVPSDWRRANPRDPEPGSDAAARGWLYQAVVEARQWLRQKLGW
jgi:endonuclease YncB( thermonuclease family)